MSVDDPKIAGLVAFDEDTGGAFKWGRPDEFGVPETVSYSFMESLPDYYDASDVNGFAPMNAAMEAAGRSVLATWASVSGIDLVEVDPSVGGEIRFGTEASDQFAGYAYYPILVDFPDGDTFSGYSGDIFISSSFDYTTDPVEGGYGYLTFLHEAGHALGLKHPFEDPALPEVFDSDEHTVMSYNTVTDADGNYPSTLGWLDIHAVQYLYGVPAAGSHGETAWGGDDADSYRSADGIDRYLANGGDDLVIMSAGDDIVLGGDGGDTLSGVSGTDMLYGGSDGDLLDGGDGTDTLSGGTGDDSLVGGGGADLLAGGDGLDAAAFEADVPDDPGRVMRDGGTVSLDGSDTVDGVEVLEFRDDAAVLTFDPVTDLANFDEARYLSLNPDVAAAVADGSLASGYVHYLVFGEDEGRAVGASYGFDEACYLDSNADVAAAVEAGGFGSGRAHFEAFGRSEGRDPNPFFDNDFYLRENPDVAAAVSAGEVASGYDHFEAFGFGEGRDPSALFDVAAYLAANPDVAAAGVNALDHYLAFGAYEGRTAYLAQDYVL